MKAELKLYEKRILDNNMLLELKMWEVPKSKKYPDVIRYSLFFIDQNSQKKILMDNHTAIIIILMMKSLSINLMDLKSLLMILEH